MVIEVSAAAVVVGATEVMGRSMPAAADRVGASAERALSCSHPRPSTTRRTTWAARSAALTTALMRVSLIPPASSSRMPSIVTPAGVVTWSFNMAGCSPVMSTLRAAPSTVWAASSVATSRGRPSLSPPSARDSIIIYT